MKEFAMKHPFLTFLLADSAIGGTVAIVKAVVSLFGGKEKDDSGEDRLRKTLHISNAKVPEEEDDD